VAKTGEVLDTMLAGAVVGAVTGAAQGLANEPGAVKPQETLTSGSSAKAHGTGEILSEMAPGAAAGAVAGAAKSVMPKAKAKGGKSKKS